MAPLRRRYRGDCSKKKMKRGERRYDKKAGGIKSHTDLKNSLGQLQWQKEDNKLRTINPEKRNT